MASTHVVTTRVPLKTAKQLEKLAKDMRRSKAWLAAEAIAEFVDANAWHIAKVREGLDQLDRGEGIPHDEVVEHVRARIAKAKRSRR